MTDLNVDIEKLLLQLETQADLISSQKDLINKLTEVNKLRERYIEKQRLFIVDLTIEVKQSRETISEAVKFIDSLSSHN